ncbi:MAG: outer membrane beta-barrel protein [Verrucomicrobia subdivision 3 bacterium]|nr:outer membrane beta-barrel protein [Limisphaerales bacterium]
METSKPWSISATLRGFYDDNYAAVHKNINDDVDSLGFEIRPAAQLNFLPTEQTFIGVGYIYSMKYYADRDENTADHTHEVTLKADHRFSERYKIEFDDSFVYAQEPTLIEEGAVGAPDRTDSDAFRNRAALNFTADITELLGVGLGYQNLWYDYDQDGDFSRSALLDRLEHLFRIDGRWRVRESTVALLGYQYGVFSYTGDEIINDPDFPAGSVTNNDGDEGVSEDRDSTSHYFYIGAEQALTTQFSASARVGAQFTDYDNLDQDHTSPYADIHGTYTYLPGSYLQFGFRHTLNATDLAGGTGNDITTDQETSALFASINHRITPRTTGSLVGQYQRSSFNNGLYDGEVDNFLLLGLNFEYRFNPNWAAELGYNYDRLDSDIVLRSYTRNRVYAGVRATY